MSHHESAARGPEARLVDRMLFFSDAVFAIVLTLLALELRAPEFEGASVPDVVGALSAVAPHFIAFVGSFALISIYWLAHLQITRRLADFDWPTAIANMFMLLAVGLIPFATDLCSNAGWAPDAFTIYCGVIVLVSIAQTGMWLIASRGGGRLMGGLSGRERLYRTVRAAIPGLCFAGGAALLRSPTPVYAYFCWVLIAPLTAIAGLALAPKAPRAPA